MTIKSMVSKELEVSVEEMTSQFQSDLNLKITQLIANAINKADKPAATSSDNKNLDSANLTKEIASLKTKLEDETVLNKNQKQKFQVELTQLRINHAEGIENLEYKLEDLKAKKMKNAPDATKPLIKEIEQLKAQLSQFAKVLEEKQKLVNKFKEADLQSVNKLVVSDKKQQDALKALDGAKQRLTVLEKNTSVVEEQQKKISQLTTRLTQASEEATKTKSNESEVVANAAKAADKRYSDIVEKLQQEQTTNVESQLKHTSQQQLIDIQQKQIKDHLNAEDTLKKEVEVLSKNAQESEKLQAEKDKSVLADKEKATEALKAELKVSQQEHESLLTRSNINKDKQEQENTQVRNTIKSLRDENKEITASQLAQSESFNEQITALEQKTTEYRLKFEYAQKQINQMS